MKPARDPSGKQNRFLHVSFSSRFLIDVAGGDLEESSVSRLLIEETRHESTRYSMYLVHVIVSSTSVNYSTSLYLIAGPIDIR